MPFYEYKAVDKSCEECCNILEIRQGILEDALTRCPYCGNEIIRLISCPRAILMGRREANQYSDIKHAKYWRDNDGNRWPVTAADGDRKSPTVSRQRKRSDEQVKAIKKAAAQQRKKRNRDESFARYVREVQSKKK